MMLKFLLPGFATVAIVALILVVLMREQDDSAKFADPQPVVTSEEVNPSTSPTFREEQDAIPVSPEEITGIQNSAQASQIHHRLALSLITELRDLSGEKRPEIIARALKPTAEKFYLLKRAVAVKEIPLPNYQTMGSEHVDSVRKLKEIWDQNQVLATAADRIYSQLGLLDCEHVPYLLRRWIQKSDRPQDL